jgi:SprT-like family
VQLGLWPEETAVPSPQSLVPSPPKASTGGWGLGTGDSVVTGDWGLGTGDSSLEHRLVRLGLPRFPRFETHRNQLVMLSWIPGRRLRVHEGYTHAPDEVLRAIVRFVTPGTRRAIRLEARRVFLGFPAEEHAPRTSRRPPTPRLRPGDATTLAELRRLHEAMNREYFDGILSEILITLSGRMRTRLGELRMDRKTGRPIYIGISRRHLRRDGWVGVRETLLHEMVHQWQAEMGRPVDHGGEFREKARAVGIVPRAVRKD